MISIEEQYKLKLREWREDIGEDKLTMEETFSWIYMWHEVQNDQPR